jgi:hypothetical protein
MGVLAVYGLVANLAVGFYTSRINNPHELREYARIQEEISDRTPGKPFDDLLHVSPTLPREGEADHFQIVGECEALYVGTGELLWPWMPVQIRELGWDLDLSGLPRDGPDEPIAITLAKPADYPGDGIVLRIEDGTFRGTFDTTHGIDGRRARPLPEDGQLRLRLVSDLQLMQYALADIDNPERGLVDIENSLPDPGWFRQQLIFHTDYGEPTTVDGIRITPVPGAPLDYCQHLRAKLGSLR